MSRLIRTLLAVGLVVAALPAMTLAPATKSAAEDVPLTCEAGRVEKTLANGASWRMCARIHPMKGLVLEEIEYRPPTAREYAGYKRILDSLSLAQLNVPYDSGLVHYNDITSYGFGQVHLMTQTEVTCLGETLDVTQTFMHRQKLISRTIPGICVDETDTGLATHSQEDELGGGPLVAERGSALELSSISKVSWYEYQQLVTLDDQGGIDVALGATGDVAPGLPGAAMFTARPEYGWPLGGETTASGETTHAASHWHNAMWRVDFGIDRGTRQHVEQWDYINTTQPPRLPHLAGAGVRKERAFSAVPDENIDELTWFRVLNPDSKNRDGHPRSYEIVNQNHPHRGIPVFAPLISFTNDRACQEYGSHNLNAECPSQSVLDYVAQDNAPLDDPVAWVNVGFHHIDRDEDQSPMHMHWQRFQLVPRDFFAQKPTISEERSCINGAGSIDSVGSPCVATNVSPPTITHSNTIAVGSLLHASPGTWNERRTTWRYEYLWLRDGEPILDGRGKPALSEHYTVAAADRGARISVRVTASQPGFPSGHADSAPVVVPGSTAEPPVERARSTVRVRAKRSIGGRRAILVVRVKSAGQPATGWVKARWKGRVIGRVKVHGKNARLTTQPFKRAGRYQVTVRYTGSKQVRPSKARVTVRVRGRR